MVMDILRCTSLICNKLHVLNKLAWLLTRVSRHHHVYAFQNTYLVQSMEWRYVHTCSFIYHTGKIHRITPFWCWVLFNLSTFYDRCYMSNRICPDQSYTHPSIKYVEHTSLTIIHHNTPPSSTCNTTTQHNTPTQLHHHT